MKVPFAKIATVAIALACNIGCDSQTEDVVDLNKVVDALVAVLDEGAKHCIPNRCHRRNNEYR